MQKQLASAAPPPWRAPAGPWLIAGCLVCFPSGVADRGPGGESAWAAATVIRACQTVAASAEGVHGKERCQPVTSAVVCGRAGHRYEPGLLALREGPLLEAAVSALRPAPDVLLVNATGRDHPRRAGLALHLGAILDLPTVGVTHRPLLAEGACPAKERGARSPLLIDNQEVGRWLRVGPGVRPLAVSPGWRIDFDTACAVVLAATQSARTPEPIRQARRLARSARSATGATRDRS